MNTEAWAVVARDWIVQGITATLEDLDDPWDASALGPNCHGCPCPSACNLAATCAILEDNQ